MTEKQYDSLKKELRTVEDELKDNRLDYGKYVQLKEKQESLLQQIDECPLIYEIWKDRDNGSMSQDYHPPTLEKRYIDKEKAYAKLDELNDGCNYGKPYFMRIEELDG